MTLNIPPMRTSNSPNFFCSGDSLPVAFISSPTNTATRCPTMSGVISMVSQPNVSGNPSSMPLNGRGFTSSMHFDGPNCDRYLNMSAPRIALPAQATPEFARNRRCLASSRRLKCFLMSSFSFIPIHIGCHKSEHVYSTK